jgi:hypothetical protein
MAGVTPGRYFLTGSAPSAVAVPGATWFLKSATVKSENAADVPVEIKPEENISNVVVTFTDRTAEVSGTLLDSAGRPTSEFSVIAFSTDRATWLQRFRRLKPPVRTGADGKFKFTGLLAGDYYLAALTDFDQTDLTNPAFLDQVAASALKISVAEGEKKTQDLKLAGG